MLPERVRRRRLVGILSGSIALVLVAAPRVNAQECVVFRCDLSDPEPVAPFFPDESTVFLSFSSGVPELQPGERQDLPENVWASETDGFTSNNCWGLGCRFYIERNDTGALWVSAESDVMTPVTLSIELETSDGRLGERWRALNSIGGPPAGGPAMITEQPCAKQVPLSPYPLAVALLLTGGFVLARRGKRPQSSSP